MQHFACTLLENNTLTCVLAVDNVYSAIWCAGVLQHFGEQHGASWDALGGLHQVGVAAHHADGEHPQGDHGGEVEGGDAGAHADGQAVGEGVHVLGDGRQRLPEHEGGDAACVLDHLWEERERAREDEEENNEQEGEEDG